MGRKKKDYIIYDCNETPLFIGGSIECAKYMKTTLNYFYAMVHMGERKPIKKIKYLVFEIEDEEENEI